MDIDRLIQQIEASKHKNPNHPSGVGFNEGLDDAITIIRQHETQQPHDVRCGDICVKNAEAALVDYFKQRVRDEFPNATVVPSDEHHRQRAEPIIQALLPYLRTAEPVEYVGFDSLGPEGKGAYRIGYDRGVADATPEPVMSIQQLRDELDLLVSESLRGKGVAGRLQAIITKIDEGQYAS